VVVLGDVGAGGVDYDRAEFVEVGVDDGLGWCQGHTVEGFTDAGFDLKALFGSAGEGGEHLLEAVLVPFDVVHVAGGGGVCWGVAAAAKILSRVFSRPAASPAESLAMCWTTTLAETWPSWPGRRRSSMSSRIATCRAFDPASQRLDVVDRRSGVAVRQGRQFGSQGLGAVEAGREQSVDGYRFGFGSHEHRGHGSQHTQGV
jgi:hypothetical protein